MYAIEQSVPIVLHRIATHEEFHNFTYQDGSDPSGTTYDVRWAVITTGDGSTASSKRFILGVRQAGVGGYFQPITLDTMVTK